MGSTPRKLDLRRGIHTMTHPSRSYHMAESVMLLTALIQLCIIVANSIERLAERRQRRRATMREPANLEFDNQRR
jgi:hypothetical protein